MLLWTALQTQHIHGGSAWVSLFLLELHLTALGPSTLQQHQSSSGNTSYVNHLLTGIGVTRWGRWSKVLSTKLHRATIKSIGPEYADSSDSPPWRLCSALLNSMPGTRDCSSMLLGTQLGWASLLKQPSPARLYLLHQGMLLLQQPFKDNRRAWIWWAASKLQPEQACWHIAHTCFHSCSFPHLQLSFGQTNLLIY